MSEKAAKKVNNKESKIKNKDNGKNLNKRKGEGKKKKKEEVRNTFNDKDSAGGKKKNKEKKNVKISTLCKANMRLVVGREKLSSFTGKKTLGK